MKWKSQLIINYYEWNLDFYAYFPTFVCLFVNFFIFLFFSIMWTDTFVHLARISKFITSTGYKVLDVIISFLPQKKVYFKFIFHVTDDVIARICARMEPACGVWGVALLLATCSDFNLWLCLITIEGFFFFFFFCLFFACVLNKKKKTILFKKF